MKSIGPTTPYGYTLFCDDLRTEVGNKYSLMGMYTGALHIQGQLPALLPKFVMIISYFERPNESTEPVEIRVFLPGDDESTPSFKTEIPRESLKSDNSQIELEEPTPDRLISTRIFAPISPLHIKKEGRIKVRAYRGDLEVRLGTLLIKALPPEGASP